MIVRGKRPEKNFTMIDNSVLRDARLSYKARGILASVLSRPENWHTTSEKLAAENPKEGRDAIRTGIQELVELGYVEIVKTQDEKGRFSTSYVFHDSPKTDYPAPDEPTPENPAPIEDVVKKTDTVAKATVSAEPSQPVSGTASSRKPNPHFDALVEVFGPASTDSRAAMYGKAVRELKQAGATPEMIVERGKEAKKRFSGKMTITPMALTKHWDDLGVAQKDDVAELRGNAQLGKNYLGYEIDDMKSGELAERLGARMVS